MNKKRIQVYTDPETKRRIELAATKHDLAVTEYCLEAIRQYLTEDDILEQEKIEIPIRQREENLVADLRALQEAILASRGGKPLDIDAVIEQVREEREEEILGLR